MSRYESDDQKDSQHMTQVRFSALTNFSTMMYLSGITVQKWFKKIGVGIPRSIQISYCFSIN